MHINPIFGTDGNPVSQDFMNGVNAAISYFDKVIANNVTLNIAFNQGNIGANAVSENTGTVDQNLFSYSTIVSALKAANTSPDDMSAIANLPPGDPFTYNDPANFPSSYLAVTNAEAKALNLTTSYGSSETYGSTDLDGTVTLNTNLGGGYSYNYSQSNIASNQVDAVGAIEHEISEVMGRVVFEYQSGATTYPAYTPEALQIFWAPYSDFGDLPISSSGYYFSIDGGRTNLGAIGEQASGGDIADWTDPQNSTNDAFGYAKLGVVARVTPVDLQEMDTIGWQVYVQPTANQAFVYQAYEGMIHRAPDTSGFNYWVSVLNAGASQNAIIQAFLNSPEYQADYGNTTNSQYVTDLYQNVLGRAPDQSGLNYWVNTLNSGTSRATVALNFVGSPENTQNQAANEQVFMTSVVSPYNQQLTYNFYQAAFGRQPDLSGFAHWADDLTGGGSQTDIASAFINSREYQSTYGNTTDSQYVSDLYQNVLHRAPDQGGLSYWLSLLDSGVSREAVFIALAASPEEMSNTSSAWVTWAQGYGESGAQV